MKRAPALLLALAALPAQAQDPAAIRAHVTYLASDALAGREAGTAGYDAAADHVARAFADAGLAPGGDAGGYLQSVPLVTYRPAHAGRITIDGRALVAGRDFVALADPRRATVRLDAPMVFVGYGLRARDYPRARVAGKVVAFLTGAPAGMPGDLRQYLGQGTVKAELAARHGAIGAVEIATRESERALPFARAASLHAAPRIGWARADGRGPATSTIPLVAVLSSAAAAGLVRSGTAARLTVDTATAYAGARSANVVGVLPGRDPALAGEAVVLSAHLDHVGIGPADARGDAVYNGAIDNAIGVAALIETARLFRGQPARRTIVFAAFTAEEKGLVGSDWFAAHPRGPRVVANVNFDMPILTYPFRDMVAFGGERSTLGRTIARTLAPLGIRHARDPIPAEGIFVRSDHFSFVRRGIPAVYLWPGPAGAGHAAIAAFMATRYHRPSDDLSQPIDWDAAARFVDANHRIARAVADADAPPRWRRGDAFGAMFAGGAR